MPAKIIDFTAPHKRKTESEIEISKVEKMALDKKMSYGQYVAMIEEEKKKGWIHMGNNDSSVETFLQWIHATVINLTGATPCRTYMRATASYGSATLPALTIGTQY